MANLRLQTKDERRRLKPRHEPYWQELDRGFHIGYRKATNGGAWYVRRYTGGRYIKRRLGAADDTLPANNRSVLSFSEARRKAANYEDLVEEIEATRHPSLYTVSDAMREYLDWYRGHRKAYRSTELSINAHVLPELGNVPVGNLTSQRIAKWLHKLATRPPTSRKGNPLPPYAHRADSGKRSKGKGHVIYQYTALPYEAWSEDMKRKRKSSANRVLTILKAALNHAWRNEKVADPAPWGRVKPFHDVEAPRVAHLTEKQSCELLAAASDEFRLLVRAALFTGCRYGELTRLRVEDLRDGQLFIERTKTGRSRYVPLSDEGREFFAALANGKARDELLLTRADGSAWGVSHQVRPMREACAKAGIVPPVGFHVLRHTYATLLLRPGDSPGVSIRYVAELLGDSVATCVKHYGHVVQEDLRAEVSRKLPTFRRRA